MKHDPSRIASILAVLGTAFDKEINPALVEIWCKSLSDIPIGEIEDAALKLCRGKFFPRPFDVIEATRRNERPAKERALLAYAEAVRAGEKYGPNRSVQFLDPATTHTIIAMGGWQAFCYSEQEVEWERKTFYDFWIAYDAQRASLENRQLQGKFAAHNGDKWAKWSGGVVLIGEGQTGKVLPEAKNALIHRGVVH